MREAGAVRDELLVELIRGRLPKDAAGIRGYGVARLTGPDGELKQICMFDNLCTTAGDQYYARMGGALVAPLAPAQPTKMSGMKLGTSGNAVTKSSTGAALGTYTTASNLAFDATYPQFAAVGGDTGWSITYKTTWSAGVATANGLAEVVIVNDAVTNATSTAANTAHRALLSPVVNKAAGDTLSCTWSVVFLGS